MKHVMIWLIGLYRKYISPLKPPCCRFTPTCSAYAIEAFQKRGFFAGLILTIWRILRCNPFGRGGYDPVPERGFKPYGGNRENTCETHTDTIDKEKDN
jgi:putative membrane protein insertion efficiency factor